MHYAGHGDFDPLERTRSGLLCSGGEWITGQDIAGLRVLPPLLFFNACKSARIRKRGMRGIRGGNVGIAESLMRGGVANFIGTYWPVEDEAAKRFAEVFYAGILRGDTLGSALAGARRNLMKARHADWGDYIHFGNPGYTVRKITGS